MNDEIEMWLEKNFSPDIQALVREIQRWVHGVLPNASEVLAVGYKMIMYKTQPKMNGFVVYVGPYTNHVNLGFLEGTSLPDPHKLLKGTGKTLRHVKIKGVGDLEQVGLQELVEAAWEGAIAAEAGQEK